MGRAWHHALPVSVSIVGGVSYSFLPALVIMRRYLGCFRPHPAPASETGSSPGSVIVHPDSVSVHHAPGAEARLDALESAVRSLERQAVVRPAYRYVVVLTAPWREFGEWEERACEARLAEGEGDVLFLSSCDATPRLTVYAGGRGAILRTGVSVETWRLARQVVRMDLPAAEDLIERYLAAARSV